MSQIRAIGLMTEWRAFTRYIMPVIMTEVKGMEYIYIYIYMGWGTVGSIVGGHRARARVILVLSECIWNAPAVSLALPTFDDNGSLGSLPRQGSIPLVP